MATIRRRPSIHPQAIRPRTSLCFKKLSLIQCGFHRFNMCTSKPCIYSCYTHLAKSPIVLLLNSFNLKGHKHMAHVRHSYDNLYLTLYVNMELGNSIKAVFQWQASTTFWNYSEVLFTGFSMCIDEKVPKRCEIPQIGKDVICAQFV